MPLSVLEMRKFFADRFRGSEVESIERIGADTGGGTTDKALGYGETLRVILRDPAAGRRELVFHTATPNDFGHDRRSDRAQSMLLDYDTFAEVPGHVAAIEVGAIRDDGSLISLADAGELFVVTEFAEGAVYAQDLRRIARERHATEGDRRRAEALAEYLADLHQRPIEGRPQQYTRAIRDLVGAGEGIFGIVDSYPADLPGAPPARLQAIEARCAEWRFRLRGRESRLALIHGDFHPFNILFHGEAGPILLDASRGCRGDPADDVTCLAINYAFFALEAPGAWRGGLAELWRGFLDGYLERTGDRGLLEVAPPYWAWRALVLCNPLWYPALSPDSRDALLTVTERILAGEPLSSELVETMLR